MVVKLNDDIIMSRIDMTGIQYKTLCYINSLMQNKFSKISEEDTIELKKEDIAIYLNVKENEVEDIIVDMNDIWIEKKMRLGFSSYKLIRQCLQTRKGFAINLNKKMKSHLKNEEENVLSCLNINDLQKLQNVNSMRIYSFVIKGEQRSFKFEELKWILGTEYIVDKDIFKRRVIEPACKELRDKLGIVVDVEIEENDEVIIKFSESKYRYC